MPELATLTAFAPLFFIVSITPGMCMTLAMSLGIRIGVRRTMWMMLGELSGVGLVAGASVVGVAAIMVNFPTVFSVLKWGGAAYLIWIGISMVRAESKLNALDTQLGARRWELISQGFITAIANPKGWIFMISFLPPFIDITRPMPLQLSGLIVTILIIEFCSLLAYAAGGKSLRVLLSKSEQLAKLNTL